MKRKFINKTITYLSIGAILGGQLLYFTPVEKVSAAIPVEYKANYKFAGERDKIQETLYQIEARQKNGQTIDAGFYRDLYNNFNVAFKYLPQDIPAYKSTYASCTLGAETLANGYDVTQSSLFSNNCLSPLNEIIKEIANEYTVSAKISASPMQGSAPLVVTFDGRSSQDNASKTTIPSNNYYWYFVDTDGVEKAIGNGPVVNYTFEKEGNYVVHLTVRSANSNKGYFDGTATININVGPQAANLIILVNGRKMNESNPLKFTSQEAADGLTIDGASTTPLGGRQILKHQWTITDSNNTTIYKNEFSGAPGVFKQKFTSDGLYTISLATIDNENNTVQKSYQLIISDPIAHIKINPEDGNTSSVYTFDASTSYSVQSILKQFEWIITDENGIQLINQKAKTIQYQFVKPGAYNVRLKITDQLGNQNEDIRIINVSSTPPVPQFTIEASKQWRQPSQFFLNATPSYDVDTAKGNDALTYEWDFSNSDNVVIEKSEDNNKKLKVSFNAKGTYKVTLTVKDSYGKVEQISKDIAVLSSLRPTIFASPLTIKLGDDTTFKASLNTNFAGNYTWEFGDGESRIVQNSFIVHRYKNTGTYRVKLTVTTADGETNDVVGMAFVGEANAPIPAVSITDAQSNILTPDSSCQDPDGNTNPAYVITRSQQITLNGSDSINVKGTKENLVTRYRPGLGNIVTRQQYSYKFGELGCQFVDMTVEDTEVNKTANRRIWFYVINAKPTMQNLTISFPQVSNNNFGIGIGQTVNNDLFTADLDPLAVRLDVIGPMDTEGQVTKYKRYYYNTDDPDRLLEIKYTPANIPYIYFTIPRIAGEYRFGVDVYDNDNAMTSSEELLGKGPIVFFPPSSNNTDIPIATLKVDKVNVKVGEVVTLETIARVTSERSDFDSQRVISYDFDGDGTWDMTTKDNKVEYVYKETGTFSPRVKVTYRGYTSTAGGEKILVEKGVKAGFLYGVVDNILIVRDASYGNITSRTFCTDLKICRSNANAMVDNQPYFKKEYPTGGKYLVKYEIQDAFGSKSAVQNVITINDPSNTGLGIVTLPASDENGVVSVGKSLDNKVLYYVSYKEGGECYIDVDIAKDSMNTGHPDQNRDIPCNTTTLYEYKNLNIGSTIARVYYSDNGTLASKDIPISFMDYNVEIPTSKQEIFANINLIIQYLSDKQPDLTSLFLQLRNAVIAGDDTSSYVLQIQDLAENKADELDAVATNQINSILASLADKTTIGANGGTDYEQSKSAIIALFPTDRKNEIVKLFEEIDNNVGDKALIKNNLEKVLGIGTEEYNKKNFEDIEMDQLKNEVCRIIIYYDIEGTSCKAGTDIATPTEIKTTGGMSKALKIILSIVGIIAGVFIILVVIFAIKAKQKEQAGQ